MSFPLGRANLLLILTALGSLAALAWMPRPDRSADLRVWVFAETHARSFRDGSPSLIQQYQQDTGASVRVDLISARAMEMRLLSLFNNASGDVPDLVEVEIGSVGMFFRPPADEVGFLPLNDFLERDGLRPRLLEARLAPWSKNGVIFGIPHDVHPVMLAYRKDLFDAAGVDPASARTWDDFQEKCLQAQARWKAAGQRRFAVGLPRADADRLLVLLLQRHVNLVDDRDRVHLADERVVDTLVRYSRMVAGPRRIADDETPGGELWARDLARGDLACVLAADWRLGILRKDAKDLAGMVALMPLPRWEAGDAPASTWGGTMMGIPRRCRDPEASWRLLKWLYFSEPGAAARRRHTDILPAIRDQWPARRGTPDAYFAGMDVDALVVELAEAAPARQVSPFTSMAKETLSIALARIVSRVEAGDDEAALRAECRAVLQQLQHEIERRIARTRSVSSAPPVGQTLLSAIAGASGGHSCPPEAPRDPRGPREDWPGRNARPWQTGMSAPPSLAEGTIPSATHP